MWDGGGIQGGSLEFHDHRDQRTEPEDAGASKSP